MTSETTVLPVDFEQQLFALQGSLFDFLNLSHVEAMETISHPQNSNDHALAALARQVIQKERLTLTHDINDIPTRVAVRGRSPQELSEQGYNVAGVYPFGLNLIYVNIAKNYCIPNTYIHELAHHFDFKGNMNARYELIINSMLGKLSESEVNLISNQDEFVAQSVAHIICSEYGVNAHVITSLSNLMLVQRGFESAVNFVSGKLNNRIYDVYTKLTEALRGASF